MLDQNLHGGGHNAMLLQLQNMHPQLAQLGVNSSSLLAFNAQMGQVDGQPGASPNANGLLVMQDGANQGNSYARLLASQGNVSDVHRHQGAAGGGQDSEQDQVCLERVCLQATLCACMQHLSSKSIDVRQKRGPPRWYVSDAMRQANGKRCVNTDAVYTYTQLAAIVRSLGGQLPGQLGGGQAGAKQAELSHAQALLQNRAMPHNQQHSEGHTLAQLQALQVSPRSRD
jgi:hypothetical protein